MSFSTEKRWKRALLPRTVFQLPTAGRVENCVSLRQTKRAAAARNRVCARTSACRQRASVGPASFFGSKLMHSLVKSFFPGKSLRCTRCLRERYCESRQTFVSPAALSAVRHSRMRRSSPVFTTSSPAITSLPEPASVAGICHPGNRVSYVSKFARALR